MNLEWPTPTEYAVRALLEPNLGTVFAILLEMDPAVATSRDKGLLIEAVQRLVREAGE